MNIENYEKFLDFIMSFINKKFEDQKEYISCTKGCAECCKTVMVPFSELEFKYLIEGYKSLSKDLQTKIVAKVKQLVNNEIKAECPFLVNNICSVYKYRGLICRSFGLLIISEENENTIPFCIHNGLNYSMVYDESTNTISQEKVEELAYKEPPKLYPFNRTLMCNLNIAKDLDLNFGESKPLIEFLKDFDKFL